MIPAVSEARDHSSRRKIMEMSAEKSHFQIDTWKLTEYNPMTFKMFALVRTYLQYRSHISLSRLLVKKQQKTEVVINNIVFLWKA